MPHSLQTANTASSSRNSLEHGRLQVLSLQLSDLGIATYSRQMRAYFAESPTCAVESVWWDEDRQWQDRMFRRLLVLDDVVLAGRARRSWVRKQNLDFHRLRGDYGPAYAARLLLTRKLHQNDYQLLHFHPQSLSHASVDLILRTPAVLQTDMTSAQLARERTDPRWRWTFAPNIALDRRVFRASRRIVVWSEWAARSVRDDYGIDPSKVCVIPPGVDIDSFAFETRRHRAGPVRILFTGYDFERKGGPDLLDVFVRRFADQAELHLMTTAPVSSNHPRVHIHRGVHAYSRAWHDLYAQADVFVMPTYHDAFGLVYIEAMAAGLPVIGSRLGAIPEIITEGKTGFVVRPGKPEELAEALAALIGDASLREKMGLQGREVVESRFDARINFRHLESVFREAVG